MIETSEQCIGWRDCAACTQSDCDCRCHITAETGRSDSDL